MGVNIRARNRQLWRRIVRGRNGARTSIFSDRGKKRDRKATTLKRSGYGLPRLTLTFDVARGLWRLEERVVVFIELLDEYLLIEEGFEFDLASVPRAAWSIIAPFELGQVAPLVHDHLYKMRGAYIVAASGGEVIDAKKTTRKVGRPDLPRADAPRGNQLGAPARRLPRREDRR